MCNISDPEMDLLYRRVFEMNRSVEELSRQTQYQQTLFETIPANRTSKPFHGLDPVKPHQGLLGKDYQAVVQPQDFTVDPKFKDVIKVE